MFKFEVRCANELLDLLMAMDIRVRFLYRRGMSMYKGRVKNVRNVESRFEKICRVAGAVLAGGFRRVSSVHNFLKALDGRRVELEP